MRPAWGCGGLRDSIAARRQISVQFPGRRFGLSRPGAKEHNRLAGRTQADAHEVWDLRLHVNGGRCDRPPKIESLPADSKDWVRETPGRWWKGNERTSTKR